MIVKLKLFKAKMDIKTKGKVYADYALCILQHEATPAVNSTAEGYTSFAWLGLVGHWISSTISFFLTYASPDNKQNAHHYTTQFADNFTL